MCRFQLLLLLFFLFTEPGLEAGKLYVGPDEAYKTIAAAMWDVTEGDTIIVRDGVYDKTIDVRSPLTLMAENRHKAVFGDGVGTEGVLRIKASNVVVDGFRFNTVPEFMGIMLGSPDSSAAITNCIIRNNEILNRDFGIWVTPNASSCTIEGNTITGSNTNGIVNSGKGVHIISKNRIEQSRECGIVISEIFSGSAIIDSNELVANGSHGAEIRKSNATLKRNTVRDNLEFGIYVRNGADNILIGDSNRVEGNTVSGIAIDANANALIENNLIYGNPDRGILVMVEASATITGNDIRGNGSYGIMNEGTAIITGNTIAENHINGIENRPGAVKTWIEDNRIMNNSENGVFLMVKADLRGNTISGNGWMGIFIEDIRETVYITHNNQVTAHAQHGIFIGGNSTAVVADNTISGNGTGVVDAEDFSGILIEGTATVEGNTIENNHGSGIRTLANCHNTWIRNNTAINGNREGIFMEGPALVENNSIGNNQLQGIYVSATSDIILKGNRLSGNRTGIFVHEEADSIWAYNCQITGNQRGIISRGKLKLRRNTIEDNTESGIWILGPGIDLGKDSIDGGYNTIRNNAPWNVLNRIPDTVHACFNYWDLAGTAEIDSTISDDDEDSLAGPVIFTPFISNDATAVENSFPDAPGDGGWGLQEIYPNPFRETVNIPYTLNAPARVRLKITDLRGRILATPVTGQHREPGRYIIQWDGRTNSGRLLPDGVYIVVIMTEANISTKRVQILR